MSDTSKPKNPKGGTDSILGSAKGITWWKDPETGKTIVSIGHCTDPCKLLELGEAICSACFVDCEGKEVTDFKIEIVNGKLIIPCNTTDFEICTAMIDDGTGTLVECPEKLIITPCGKDPLPPIWLNPVRSVNGTKPDKNGNVKVPDCCHYHMQSATNIDPDNPPTQPPSNPAGEDKSVGDTAHVCHKNGSCYYTCKSDGWVLDYCKIITDCCHYHVSSSVDINPTDLPTAPPRNPAGTDKSDGDTMHVCHPNGSCYWTCAEGAWVLDFCKIQRPDCCAYHTSTTAPVDLENPPAAPASDPTSGAKAVGDTIIECRSNGICYWTCKSDGWVLDYCKIDQVGCCTYFVASATVVDDNNPPGTPPNLPGVTAVKGDTAVVCYPNGTCYYTYDGAEWKLDYCKFDCCHYHEQSIVEIDPAAPPQTPQLTDTVVGSTDGDTLHVCHPNGSCFYTKVDGEWVFDFCKVLLTKEDVVAAFQAAGCPASGQVSVLTADCTAIPVKELLPCANVGECESIAESITNNAPIGATTPEPKALAATQIFQDLVGSGQVFIFSGSPDIPGALNPGLAPAGISAADFPYTVNLPTPSPGCIFSVHVSYGGHYVENGGFDDADTVLDDPALTGGADIKQVGDCAHSFFADKTHMGSAAWLVDGSGPLTLDFGVKNFTGEGAPGSGGFQIRVAEICDTTGVGLTNADFDCGAIHSEDGVRAANNPTPGAGTPFDMGDCDALVFAGGRHVNSRPELMDYSLPDSVDTDYEWMTVDNDASTVYEATALNGSAGNGDLQCQFGIYMGLIPGGSGAGGWSWQANAPLDQASREACLMAVPLACPEPTEPVPSAPVYSSVCAAAAINTNCLCDSIKCASVCAGGQILAQAGHIVKVTPVIDGVPLTKQTQICDNSFSEGPAIDSMVWGFDFTGDRVAPGVEAACSLQFCVEICTAEGDTAISTEDSIFNLSDNWGISLKLIPVC